MTTTVRLGLKEFTMTTDRFFYRIEESECCRIVGREKLCFDVYKLIDCDYNRSRIIGVYGKWLIVVDCSKVNKNNDDEEPSGRSSSGSNKQQNLYDDEQPSGRSSSDTSESTNFLGVVHEGRPHWGGEGGVWPNADNCGQGGGGVWSKADVRKKI